MLKVSSLGGLYLKDKQMMISLPDVTEAQNALLRQPATLLAIRTGGDTA